MRSLLNTIPGDTPFAFERQGYWANYRSGVPIADGPSLLPFYSMPFDSIQGAQITAWLKCIDGSHAFNLGSLPIIEKNDTWTIYHDGSDLGVVVPMGYYFVEVGYKIPPQDAGLLYSEYLDRVERAKGVVEAQDCLIDALVNYSSGWVTGTLFKTEPFWMPQAGTLPTKLGDFNDDFNDDFLT